METIQVNSQTARSEGSNIDYVKVGFNPAFLIVIIIILVYLLGRCGGSNNKSNF